MGTFITHNLFLRQGARGGNALSLLPLCGSAFLTNASLKVKAPLTLIGNYIYMLFFVCSLIYFLKVFKVCISSIIVTN